MYVLTWLIAPPLAFDAVYRIIAVLCCGLWLIIHANTPAREDRYFVKGITQRYLIFGISFVFIRILCSCLFDGMTLLSAFNNNIHYSIILIVGYISIEYLCESNRNKLNQLFNFITLLSVLFSVTSIFRGNEYSNATRQLKIMTEVEREYARQIAMNGIGTFGFFSFTSLLVPFVYHRSKCSIGRNRLLYFVSTGILLWGVFSSGYAIALLVAIIGISCEIVTSANSKKTKVIIALFAILISLIVYFLSPVMLKGLSILLRGTMFENKVYDMLSSLEVGQFSGTFSDRWIRYSASIDGILKSFFMGSYLVFGRSISGGHSSILDAVSQYGILGGLLWNYMSIRYPLYQMRDEGGYKLYAIPLIMTMILNPYTIVLSSMYFVYPILRLDKFSE